MESYRSTCPDCGVTYSWKGYKEGTKRLMKEMRERQTVCWECESPNLITKTLRDARAEEVQKILLETSVRIE